MKASEAKSLFEKNSKGIDFIYDYIKQQSEQGFNYACFPHPIDNHVTELLNNGFTIKKFEDPYGVEATKVLW